MVTVLVTDPTSAAGPSPRTGTETKSGPCFLQMTLKTNYVSNSGAPKNIDTLMMQQILSPPQWSIPNGRFQFRNDLAHDLERTHGIGKYVNFYNSDRPHSTLDGSTPDQVYFNSPRAQIAA